MLKRYCLIIILLVGYFPAAAYSNDLITVTVLPFQVYAQEDLSYLQTEIPRLINQYLKAEVKVVAYSGWTCQLRLLAGYKSVLS